IVQSVDPMEERTQALILCPTRELAIQAADDIRQYAKYFSGIRVLPIYGGQDISKQIRSLKGNAQIVVGTPGRVMDHIRRHTLKLTAVRTVVLDEADEMLDMGFREDIETILKDIPQEHQTALFSATMPKPILQITREYQKEDAVFVKIPSKELTIPLVKQYYYEIPKGMKVDAVSRLLDYYNPKRTLIFTNTKRMADELSEALIGRGYFADALHGDLAQQQRDHVMSGFRSGGTEILIATDVAARGIDIDDVEAVINYDVPDDIEYYVHRIGRTGRAGRKGRAFTLVVGRELYKIRDIERHCHTRIESRHIPNATDVKASKAQSVLDSVVEIAEGEDLSDMINMIETKMSDSELTSLDIAAAFLKKAMGSDKDAVSDADFITYRSGDRRARKRAYVERDRARRDKRDQEELHRKGGRGSSFFKKIRSRDINTDGTFRSKRNKSGLKKKK
nr:DEAD/DEAH box helicase [Lachnospiraceae bacterium]